MVMATQRLYSVCPLEASVFGVFTSFHQFSHFKHFKLPVFAAMKEYMAKVSMLEDDEKSVPFQCGDQILRRLLDGVEACHLR